MNKIKPQSHVTGKSILPPLRGNEKISEDREEKKIELSSCLPRFSHHPLRKTRTHQDGKDLMSVNTRIVRSWQQKQNGSLFLWNPCHQEEQYFISLAVFLDCGSLAKYIPPPWKKKSKYFLLEKSCSA